MSLNFSVPALLAHTNLAPYFMVIYLGFLRGISSHLS